MSRMNDQCWVALSKLFFVKAMGLCSVLVEQDSLLTFSLFTMGCDETKPSCSNCRRRLVTCDFTIDDTPQPTISPSGLNLTDLELLHNYTSTTYRTFADNMVGTAMIYLNMTNELDRLCASSTAQRSCRLGLTATI